MTREPHDAASRLEEWVEALHSAVSCLERWRVRYALVGARALAAWGDPRPSDDVDLLVHVDPRTLGALSARMVERGMWNIRFRTSHSRHRFRNEIVDLVRPFDDHDRYALTQTVQRRIDGRTFPVVSPEDFLLQKLKVGRGQDYRDAALVLRTRVDQLDSSYVNWWTRRMGRVRQLEQAMRLAGMRPARSRRR